MPSITRCCYTETPAVHLLLAAVLLATLLLTVLTTSPPLVTQRPLRYAISAYLSGPPATGDRLSQLYQDKVNLDCKYYNTISLLHEALALAPTSKVDGRWLTAISPSTVWCITLSTPIASPQLSIILLCSLPACSELLCSYAYSHHPIIIGIPLPTIPR